MCPRLTTWAQPIRYETERRYKMTREAVEAWNNMTEDERAYVVDMALAKVYGDDLSEIEALDESSQRTLKVIVAIEYIS